MTGKTKTIYNVPSGCAFLDTVAKGLMAMSGGDQQTLATYRILLPTRRSLKGLRDSFLRQNDGKPLILPQMSAIGDVDGEELDLRLAALVPDHEMIDIPSAISPLRRRILLGRFVQEHVPTAASPDLALMLADALGRFMDQVHTENLNLDDLDTLVDGFAEHWNLTLNVLRLLREEWRKTLDAMGMIDASDRRNRLLKGLAQYWTIAPPQTPVMAAGIIGSVPSVATLLSVVAQLPQGSVILPGLDTGLDETSWEALSDTHPQASMKTLLSRLDVPRGRVTAWPYGPQTESHPTRWDLTRAMMQPPETITDWTQAASKKDTVAEGLKGIVRYDCATPHEEASVISLILREALETEGKTATVITPDRSLARRISAMMQRWGVLVDDSAGKPLTATSFGSYFMGIAECIESDYAPVATLSLLKHRLCRLGTSAQIAALERDWRKGEAIVSPILDSLRAQLDRMAEGHSFMDFLQAHIVAAEALAGHDSSAILWIEEDGEAASKFLMELNDNAGDLPSMTFKTYAAIMRQFLNDVPVRPIYGTHPRIYILGLIESRLIQSDVTILCGLNEGTWPGQSKNDPWMSRPMRKRFGLPSTELSIGLSAHDFVSGFCAGDVYLTRSERADGTPTVPSRWLQRLETYITAAGLDAGLTGPHLSWARRMDEPDAVQATSQPRPAPAVSLRPRDFSVTDVERWMKNPYRIYAEKILKIKPLDPLESDQEYLVRGNFMHAVLYEFIKSYPAQLPANAHTILMEIAGRVRLDHAIDDVTWVSSRPRLEKIITWFLSEEQNWRTDSDVGALETRGETVIEAKGGNVRLYARADRIDVSRDGHAAVIDYKTGTLPSKIQMKTGVAPQLPLEGFILQRGGFEHIGAREVGHLRLLKVWGRHDIRDAGKDSTEYIDNAALGFQKLIDAFDTPATPYIFSARHYKNDRHDERAFAHLGRLAEWNVVGDDSGDADDAGEAA